MPAASRNTAWKRLLHRKIPDGPKPAGRSDGQPREGGCRGELFADTAEAALRSEGDKGHSLIFGEIKTSRARALSCGQIDHVSCKGRFDGHRSNFGAEPETG